MGGLFSSSNSNLGSVPKELKDYIIQNPTEIETTVYDCSMFLKFTDGDKDPDLTYESRVIDEIKKSNNNSKSKYINVCVIPNRPPEDNEIENYKNSLFIYYTIDNRKVLFKILPKYEKYIVDRRETAYKFKGDNESYHPGEIYTVEKPKKKNNQTGGSKKKYKNKKNIKNKKKQK